MTNAEIEATFQRIQNRVGVQACLALTRDTGLIIKSVSSILNHEKFAQLAHTVLQAADAAQLEVEPEDQVKFLRVRTGKYEVMISPASQYTLVVIQDPTEPKN